MGCPRNDGYGLGEGSVEIINLGSLDNLPDKGEKFLYALTKIANFGSRVDDMPDEQRLSEMYRLIEDTAPEEVEYIF